MNDNIIKIASEYRRRPAIEPYPSTVGITYRILRTLMTLRIYGFRHTGDGLLADAQYDVWVHGIHCGCNGEAALYILDRPYVSGAVEIKMEKGSDLISLDEQIEAQRALLRMREKRDCEGGAPRNKRSA